MDSFHSKLNHDMFSPFTSHVTVLQRKIININTPINAVTNFTDENDVTDSSNTPTSGQNTTFQVKPMMRSRVVKSNVGANASPSIYIQFWNPKLSLICLNHHYVLDCSSKNRPLHDKYIGLVLGLNESSYSTAQ